VSWKFYLYPQLHNRQDERRLSNELSCDMQKKIGTIVNLEYAVRSILSTDGILNFERVSKRKSFRGKSKLGHENFGREGEQHRRTPPEAMGVRDQPTEVGSRINISQRVEQLTPTTLFVVACCVPVGHFPFAWASLG